MVGTDVSPKPSVLLSLDVIATVTFKTATARQAYLSTFSPQTERGTPPIRMVPVVPRGPVLIEGQLLPRTLSVHQLRTLRRKVS